MNIVGVPIAELNIDLSAKRRAIAAGAGNGQRLTVESVSELEPRGAGDSVRNEVFSPTNPRFCRPTNSIEKVNQAAAHEIDRAYWISEGCKWPLDLMGGAIHSARRPEFTIEPKLRESIIETERLLKDEEPASHPLLGDDIQLEYYEDGYPKLPACLDCRSLPELAQAA
jgi:hypothetical protein